MKTTWTQRVDQFGDMLWKKTMKELRVIARDVKLEGPIDVRKGELVERLSFKLAEKGDVR